MLCCVTWPEFKFAAVPFTVNAAIFPLPSALSGKWPCRAGKAEALEPNNKRTFSMPTVKAPARLLFENEAVGA